jgi:type I site-specific restriction endonuclease
VCDCIGTGRSSGAHLVLNEADTCRKFVVPKLLAAGWDTEPHSIAEQRTITDGRIVPLGQGFVRRAPKRVDYLLRYTRDFSLAVVEAKDAYRHAADGLQQAKQYAEMLGLKFAYATNGHEIIEFDYSTGLEGPVPVYPPRGVVGAVSNRRGAEAARGRQATHVSGTDRKRLARPAGLEPATSWFVARRSIQLS